MAIDRGAKTIDRDRRQFQRFAPEGQFSVTNIKTLAYTAQIGELVRCNPTGGGFTVNLPGAASYAGRQIIVKNVSASANNITIDGRAAETIDGSATLVIAGAYISRTLVSDGANWMVT